MTFEEQKRIISEALDKAYTPLEWFEQIIEIAYEKGKKLPPVKPQLKTGHCKNCKWWKDSDGFYRRGVHAKSQCPINSKEVFEGNGYCYMFEPQEGSE